MVPSRFLLRSFIFPFLLYSITSVLSQSTTYCCKLHLIIIIRHSVVLFQKIHIPSELQNDPCEVRNDPIEVQDDSECPPTNQKVWSPRKEEGISFMFLTRVNIWLDPFMRIVWSWCDVVKFHLCCLSYCSESCGTTTDQFTREKTLVTFLRYLNLYLKSSRVTV